jgi:hypothetical protein
VAAEEQDVERIVDEEPAYPSLADAQKWLMLYSQLLEFTEVSLQNTYRFLETVAAPARRHLQRNNIAIMEEEIRTFRDRREHWKRIADELAHQ